MKSAYHNRRSLRVHPAARRLLFLSLLCLIPVTARAQGAAAGAPGITGAPQDVVWMEGEAPSSITPTTLKPNIAGWGHPEYLSGLKWLQISIDADKVESQAPADGIVLSYALTAPRAADYQVWNRIGYERARSPFEWRIDEGAWNTIGPDQDTIDVEDLVNWNPVAWLEMGTAPLTAGPHTLQIRLPRTKDKKGNTAQILYASDAICLDASPFHPDGPHRPGDDSWRTSADRAAAANFFQPVLPVRFRATQAGQNNTGQTTTGQDNGAAQRSLSLRGDWEIAPSDEMVVDDRTGPIKALPDPADLTWRAIPVPSDRNASVPELTYVHRYFLRCRVSIPGADADHSFYLHFPSINLIATLFVNGQSCGWTKAPFATWDCDITRFVRPGQINTIVVGMKDPFYALADEADARHIQYTPYDFWHYNTTNQLDFPILSHYQTGILQTPTLVTAGPQYTSDVFAIPSVKNKTLGLEITVNNPADQPAT
ncbi:MAG: hypothetical protein LC772_04810, partial [Chloroflexi bacterium]|nr:hypothetical protein [Chloroflexota bacterium]